eukprot:scaffold27355_cov135-Isochrysis_galbana.AAC.3
MDPASASPANESRHGIVTNGDPLSRHQRLVPILRASLAPAAGQGYSLRGGAHQLAGQAPVV